jgi:anti-anti-sigma factor
MLSAVRVVGFALHLERVELLWPVHREPEPVVRYEVVERTDDYVVLKITGDLTADFQVARLHEILEEHYVDDGVRVIRVNMEGVSFLSLEGVAMVVDLFREASARGKRFVVEGVQDQPRSKLALTGVLRMVSGPDE